MRRWAYVAVVACGLFGGPVCRGAVLEQFGGTCSSWPMTWNVLSGVNDPEDTKTAAHLNFVGNAANPGGYWAQDNNYIYFRVRVAVDSITADTYRDSILVLIDKVGYSSPGQPDYAFAWDSKSQDNNNHGLEMQILGTAGPTWTSTTMDDLDGSVGLKLTRDINGANSTERAGEGYVRTVDGVNTGADFGLTSFIDFAVSWSYLSDPAKGNTALGPGQTWNVTFGSIANATDHNSIGTDVAGGASPSSPLTAGWGQFTSDPLTPSDPDPEPGPDTVPEPSTFAVASLLAGLGLLVRRRSGRTAQGAKQVGN